MARQPEHALIVFGRYAVMALVVFFAVFAGLFVLLHYVGRVPTDTAFVAADALGVVAASIITTTEYSRRETPGRTEERDQ